MLDSGIAISTIRTLIDDVRQLGLSIEPIFIKIGETLAESAADLSGLQQEFAALSASLESDDMERIGLVLGEAAQKSMVLSLAIEGEGDLLAPVTRAVQEVGKPLNSLKQIGSEVGALSVNAKVLAAQVHVAGIDFSVFTQEIGRLGALGSDAVQKTEASLEIVKVMVNRAQDAFSAFGKDNAAELTQVAQRMDICLSFLARRQDASRNAINRMSAMTKDIEEKISQCVASLQINDLTSQRIDHIAVALDKLCHLLEEGPTKEGEYAWAVDFDSAHLAALALTVCTLQKSQFLYASEAFSKEVDKIISSLTGLSSDVWDIHSITKDVFQGDKGENFIRDVQTHAETSARLLDMYVSAKQQICTIMGDVSEGFKAMSQDVSAINSIDADIRVMGLNATFKCGRLGDSGRALGVVAQELRSCSRRTEESSAAVVTTIAPVAQAITDLVDRTNTENSQAESLTTQTETALAELTNLVQTLETSVLGLQGRCNRLAVLMEKTVSSIDVNKIMAPKISSVLDRLSQINWATPIDDQMLETVQDDVRKFLASHYTMEGERTIHALFDALPAERTEISATSAETQSMDDIFF